MPKLDTISIQPSSVSKRTRLAFIPMALENTSMKSDSNSCLLRAALIVLLTEYRVAKASRFQFVLALSTAIGGGVVYDGLVRRILIVLWRFVGRVVGVHENELVLSGLQFDKVKHRILE